jgi:ribonuclease P protein component
LTFSFHKQERLCSKKQIDLLFKSGKGLLSYPLKAVYIAVQADSLYNAQAMFIVPKKQFKKAHDRNTLKRRTREAYRLNKQLLYDELQKKDTRVLIAFLYVGKKEENFALIQKSMLKLLKQISAC